MPDLPPPSSGFSDPQLAALLEQNKARNRRVVLIFVAVALVLGVGIGGSAFYSSVQAKKKRNVAYSKVVKCLFGKPLDAGEAPMTRVRSAWRASILAEKNDPSLDVNAQEAAKAKAWPNRCVPQLMAFTDTLKDIGEMKEGDKDLGFYSRDLSKQTAGDNWKNVDTYQAALQSWVDMAQKGNFEFVDVPDVQAPELLDAQSIDVLFPKSSALVDTKIDPHPRTIASAQAARFFVPAGKGKPSRLCSTADGKEIACLGLGWLPPEAAGIPWVLPADDGAPTLLAFGREGGVADGSSVSTGVFRSSDGVGLVGADAYYVVGGFAQTDGTSAVLMKALDDPRGDKFVLGRASPGAAKVDIEKVALTDWNERPSAVAMVGPWVLWVNSKQELIGRAAFAKDATPTTIATLPGPLPAGWNNGGRPAIVGCETKSGWMIGVRVRADSLDRMLIVPATEAAFGKTQVTDDGSLACSEDAAIVLGDDALTTCNDAGCKATKIEGTDRHEVRAPVDGSLVRVSSPSGLLRVEWEKDGKSIATKIYDAQVKGGVLLSESKLEDATLVPRRGYALLFVEMGGTQHVARVDSQGGITSVSFKP
ncbi:MAG TPA: hypothetical protein VGH28_18785 [Polyangiaceae bacterium]|jgi:hypothetical protein